MDWGFEGIKGLRVFKACLGETSFGHACFC